MYSQTSGVYYAGASLESDQGRHARLPLGGTEAAAVATSGRTTEGDAEESAFLDSVRCFPRRRQKEKGQNVKEWNVRGL